jgi:hypothetical protein
MNASGHRLLLDLESIVSQTRDRQSSLEAVATRIRSSGNYRWVGLYDVDHAAGLVRNLSWSGPGAPEHPTFPLTKGSERGLKASSSHCQRSPPVSQLLE